MIEVKIRHPQTGEVRVYKDESYAAVPGARGKPPYSLVSALFQYTENNYSCDCNRRRFFERAGGEPESEGDDRCSMGNTTVFRIELWCDGEMFYSDMEGV